MAIVGEAYVAIRAITTRLRGDIESAVRSAGVDFEAIGREHGDRYGNAFGNAFNENIQGNLNLVIADAFDAAVVGSNVGDEIGTAISNGVAASLPAGLAASGAQEAGFELGEDVVRGAEDGVNNGGGGGLRGVGRRAGNGFFDALSGAVVKVIQLGGKILLLGSAISVAIGGISALVSGLFAITAAAGPATYALAALAAQGISFAAQAFLTLKLAFSGVGTAISALNKQAAAASGGIGRVGAAAKSAAQKLLEQMQAEDALKNAQDAVTEANKRAKKAQEDLNKAREQAKEDLQQLNFSLRQSAIDEGTALIALQKAREKLALVAELPVDNRLRQEAQFAYDQAQLNYEQAVDTNNDLTKEQQKAAKAGVEGSDVVKDAKENLADAQQAQIDAERNLTEVLLQQKVAAEQANRALGAGGAAAIALQNALAGLSPEARRFAEYISSLKPKFDELKASAGRDLFPKLETAIQGLVDRLFPSLNRILEETGGALGDIAIMLSDAFTTPQFLQEFNKVADDNVVILKNIGEGLASLVEAFSTLMAAASPFVVLVSEDLKDAFAGFNSSVQGAQKDGSLTALFSNAFRVARQLWRIIKDVFGAIGELGSAAAPAGQGLLDFFEEGAKKLREFFGSEEGQAELGAKFQAIADNVKPILGFLKDLVGALFDVGANPALGETAESLRTDLLPAVKDLVDNLIEVAPKISEALSKLGPILDGIFKSGVIEQGIGLFDSLASIIGGIASGPSGPGLIKFVSDFAFGATAAFKVFGAGKKTVDGLVTAGKGVKDFVQGVRTGSGLINATSTTAQKIGAVTRTAFDGAREGFKKFADIAKPGIGKIKDGIQAIKDRASGGGDAGFISLEPLAKGFDKVKDGVGRATKAIKDFGLGQKIASAATKVWTGIQAAFNIVMSLNPIGLIVLGIAALIAIVVVAYNKIDWFREFVDKAFKWIGDTISAVIDWVKQNWPLLLAILTGPIGLAVKYIIENWDKIKAGITKVKDWIVTKFNEIKAFITGLPAKLAEAGSAIWTWIKDKLAAAWELVKTLIVGYVRFVTGIPGRLLAAGGALWNFIGDKLSEAWKTVTDFFTNTILPFFTGIGAKIGRAASGMWDGIKTAFKDAINWLIDKWNGLSFRFGGGTYTILGRDISLPEISLDTPNIPRLAAGATVLPSAGGTLAVLAEAGKAERVSPLNEDGYTAAEARLLDIVSRMGAGNNVPPIIVNPSADMDEVELAHQVSRQVSWNIRMATA